MALTDAQRFHLDTAFSRLLSFAGLPNGLSGFNLSDLADQGDSLTLTRDLTLWVDGTAGNDAGSGLQSDPLKTLGAAKAKLPLVIRHLATINIKAGTYAEVMEFSNFISGSGTIRLIGQDWSAVTPATGIATGTFDASFGSPAIPNTALVTGAGWTVNDLKGKWIEITTGALTGSRYPIASNTATTIDLGFPAATTTGGGHDLRSTGFKFVTPAVVLTFPAGAVQCILGIGCVDTQGGFVPATGLGTGLYVQNIKFTTTVNSAVRHRFGEARFENCEFVSTSAIMYRLAGSAGAAEVLFQDCLFNSSSSAFHIQASVGGRITAATNSVVLGGSLFINAVTAVAAGITGLFDGQTAEAVIVGTGSQLFLGSSFVIRNTANGIVMNGTSSFLSCVPANGGFGFITNCSGAGVVMNTTGFSRVQLGATTIDTCANGISMSGSHNALELSGATGICTIKNSTQWGVNMAADKRAAFNEVITDTATVMSSNTSGDFTLDGSAVTSLATLRAAPNKTVLETATRLNRLSEI